ncbi:hypothetical protein FDK21_19025 [Cohaesibacter sp. CAU 1516]|uniref:sensor histidine kinase n=1 Tax=Cohaesibacter sp. CAU 1516 TaxID=2576038 RepID=UPI0010FF3B77|nr:ATP-binding protein [Cohaesibacter sp. CAU 1516]TLP42776.1 hypothetical protein FDK21_19025 [Cohaesibacter sp. CAU 1516]
MVQSIQRPAVLVRQHRKVLAWLAFGLTLLVVVATVLSYRGALLNSQANATARLTLQLEGLVNALDKYRLLTPLLARRPDLLTIFSSTHDDDDMETALQGMARIGGMSDAVDIRLTFLNGLQLSTFSSRQEGEVSSDPEILKRPDIVQALEGRLGRWLRHGSEGRIYVFSFAARIDGQIAGVVSVHVDLSGTEQIWALSPQPILATKQGRVLLTNQTAWLNAQMDGHTDHAHPWTLEKRPSLFGPLLIDVRSRNGAHDVAGDYVAARRTEHVLGWTFYALEPLRRPVMTAATALVISSLISGLVLGALSVEFNRQQMQLRQRRKDLATSQWLERRVRDRTRELRQTQEGLIHSAKLAAIGQMSMVLSHEYNQPLSAIRSYADNAQLLFSAGRYAQGQDNLSRIGKLVDRLANLSKTLKTFARKPGVDLKSVSVDLVLDESVMLMQPQARKVGATLEVVREASQLLVTAGHTRLEQVLINLIANALDAIAEQDSETRGAAGRVRIRVARDGDNGIIEISDNGPGIEPALRAEIFEPFVTSKGHGVGLGLGLPIASNLVSGFGGSLSLVDPADDEMKTTFRITLPLANDG